MIIVSEGEEADLYSYCRAFHLSPPLSQISKPSRNVIVKFPCSLFFRTVDEAQDGDEDQHESRHLGCGDVSSCGDVWMIMVFRFD